MTVLNNDGLPLFDRQGRLLTLNDVQDIVDQDDEIYQRDANGEPVDGQGLIAQPPIGIRIQALLVMVNQNNNNQGVQDNQQPIQVPRQPPAGFGRTPARANGQAVINYNTREGQNIYRENSRSLYCDSEGCFDLTNGKLNGFLGKLEHRAAQAGWTIMDIVIDNATGVTRNLIRYYGEINADQVWNKVHTYDQTFTRAEQDDAQLFACLIASISDAAQNTLALKETSYTTVTGEHSGLLYLKLIITESTLETKSTINDVDQAHGWDAKDHGGTREAEDSPFYRFIEQLENSYNDRTELSTDSLMTKADQKYKDLLEKEQIKGKNKKDDAIMALTTKVEQLTEKCEKLKDGGSNSNNGKAQSGKYRKPPSWVFNEPSNEEPKTKTVDGKVWNWCEGNGAHKPRWVTHKLSECRGTKNGSGESKASDKNPKEKKEKEPVKWTAAMNATIEDKDSDDE
ncbi:unknown protein [Seminavis robusta]|uniref:Uncharacterized protein n=1 Tax=Seminavis robusta TaxID=568900 RepID=A0A9N8HSG2_9STRA|nr:unknown protein [Seminavis robusta]|eukprot:Sro1518_g279220.1 n/a (455) ;mRNA; f:11937-13416